MTELLIILFLASSVFSIDADLYWGQWHGPANGRACLASGGPGTDLELSHSLNLETLLEYAQNDINYFMNNGIQVRADDKHLYVRIAKDYYPSDKILWELSPDSGKVLWHTTDASALEDMPSPRSFQLYNDPRGFNSIHISPYYLGSWDTYRLDNNTREYLLPANHACMGSRILMGKWAWKNNEDAGGTWNHTGQLVYWDNTSYSEKQLDYIQMLDHAWENGRCILFALSGAQQGDSARWKSARFMLLDSSGAVLRDTAVHDIHRPISATSCYVDYPSGSIADTGDILMKLAVQGDYVYAVERATFFERQLTRRQISQGFRKTDSIVLGTEPALSNISYSLSDSALYLHNSDTLTAYTLDLRNIRWKRPMPHRTLFHLFLQGIARDGGLSNRIMHSIACDTAYVYCVTDSHFIVLDQKTGTTLFDHLFTDLPSGALPYYPTIYTGAAGTVTLMPDYVIVSGVYVCSRLWIFRKTGFTSVSQPVLQPSEKSFTVSVFPNPFCQGSTIRSKFSPGFSGDNHTSAHVEIYNALGIRIERFAVTAHTLENGVAWSNGAKQPAGMYCVRVCFQGRTINKKFMLVR